MGTLSDGNDDEEREILDPARLRTWEIGRIPFSPSPSAFLLAAPTAAVRLTPVAMPKIRTEVCCGVDLSLCSLSENAGKRLATENVTALIGLNPSHFHVICVPLRPHVARQVALEVNTEGLFLRTSQRHELRGGGPLAELSRKVVRGLHGLRSLIVAHFAES
ncbi:hypothetical protein FHL15_000235 [Xylaria flabelliformis]|uniref:Uncharacterized protein n=1 Tax=Xylaria flabelliformis TaxID=2512241 RepID=A0A553IFB0_9PEZI|nr:hypothetical protein FHL15_000235 [Xylaria flabelliformis]